jgi:nitrate reductase gamma subunit
MSPPPPKLYQHTSYFSVLAMENFYTSVKPFYNFARILGFFPLVFEGPVRKGVLKKALWTSLLPLMVLLILSVCNVLHYKHFVHDASSEFLKFSVWSIATMVNYTLLLLQFIFHLTKASKVKKFMVFMQKCDEKFNATSLFIDHKQQRKYIKCLIFAVLLLTLLRYIETLVVYKIFLRELQRTSFVQEHFCAYFMLYECFFCLQFIIPAYIVRERFKILKSSLR